MKQKLPLISILLVILLNSICAQSNKSFPIKNYPREKAEPASPVSGNGTPGNPYEIATVSNLLWLSENKDYWGDWFIQTADIDISESREWNNGDGFASIGNNLQSFYGNYNGKGHIINGVYIHRISDNFVGFFGILFGATIDSLGITNCEVMGKYYTGGLAGYNEQQCSIGHCYVEGDVNGSIYVGGVIGYTAFDSHISHCFFTGNVSASQFAGGIAGTSSESSISDCYSTGNIRGMSYLGGLVGSNEMYSSIKDCYASGKVTCSTYMSSGGLAGFNRDLSTLNNCYWNPVSAGQSRAIAFDEDMVLSCTGLTTPEMKNPENFTGWDFENTWGIVDNRSYPALKLVNDNAPFAFADTIKRQTIAITLASLLSNDYDYETQQHSLTCKIISVSSGSWSHDTLYLPASTESGDTVIINYRAGEIHEGKDTLWGNTATSLLIIRNNTPNLMAVTNISIPEDSKLILTLNDITVSDPDGQELSIIIEDGLNFTQTGDTIIPRADYNGLLSVNIAASDGQDTSNTMTMLVNVMAVNDAPIVQDTITITSENTVLAVNMVAMDVDGTVSSVSIDRDPEHGTAKHAGMIITYTPGEDFTGQDTITWYAVDDKGLASGSAMMAITVVADNPTPVTELQDPEIILYPNPCPGLFFINAGPQAARLYIYDLNGNEVFTQWVQDLTHVDISRLERGAYIVKVNGMNLRLVRN